MSGVQFGDIINHPNDANFWGSAMIDTNLTNADLSYANLTGTNLTGR